MSRNGPGPVTRRTQVGLTGSLFLLLDRALRNSGCREERMEGQGDGPSGSGDIDGRVVDG